MLPVLRRLDRCTRTFQSEEFPKSISRRHKGHKGHGDIKFCIPLCPPCSPCLRPKAFSGECSITGPTPCCICPSTRSPVRGHFWACERSFANGVNNKNSACAPEGNAVPISRAFLTFELLKTSNGGPPPRNCGPRRISGRSVTMRWVRSPVRRFSVIRRLLPRCSGGRWAMRWAGRSKKKSLVFMVY